MKHLTQEDLILHYYGETVDGDAEQHMAECAECRTGYRALQQVLNVVDEAPVPNRPLGYGQQVWDRVAPQLPPARRNLVRGWFFPRRLAAGAGIVAVAAAAFLAGIWVRQDRQHGTAPPVLASGQLRERVLLVALGDHFDRSQLVLSELVNTAHRNPRIDISIEREMAAELVESNRLYRQTAVSTGEQNVAAVLDDLERLLLEIAHGPAELAPIQLEELRKRIETQNLLYKVRVLGAQMRDPAALTKQEY